MFSFIVSAFSVSVASQHLLAECVLFIPWRMHFLGMYLMKAKRLFRKYKLLRRIKDSWNPFTFHGDKGLPSNCPSGIAFLRE